MEVRARLRQVARRPEEIRTTGEIWPDVRRITVVRQDRLGDFVLTIPAIQALGCAYPEAEVSLMVGAAVAPLARMVAGVAAVAEVDSGSDRARQRLQRLSPDLLICISRDRQIPWAGWREGVRHTVGPGRRVYSPLFERQVSESRRAGRRHEVEFALSFAHRAGAGGGPARFPIRLPASAESDSSSRLADLGVDGRYVVLHPGTGGSCPAWPVEHFAQLYRGLIAAGVATVLTHGPGDADVVAGFTHGSGAPSWFGGEIPALAALLRRAALVVSNSTGPLHLAAALGTATLALHAPWPTCGVPRWGPYADNGWAIVAEHVEARRWSHRERGKHAGALMRAIQPELVLGCAQDLLAGLTPAI